MGGLLLAPPRTDAGESAPASAAPFAVTGEPSDGPAASAPASADTSPRAPKADKADGRTDAVEAGGAEAFLPPELRLADILPFTPSIGGEAAPDAAEPSGPAPDGQAVAAYGSGSDGQWPLMAGLAVSLVFLAAGAGFLWWRNREARYWPA